MEEVQTKLDALKQLDRFRRVFGASHHQYQLRPKITAAEIDATNLPIPQQLRDFYTQMGNGGAGPNYGILPHDKLFSYHPDKPYPGAAFYRDLAKANDALLDDEDAVEDGYFEVNHDAIDGLLGIVEEGCGHVTCIVTAGEQLGEIVHVSCDGYVNDTGIDFLTYYNDWLDSNIELLERVKALVDESDRPLEEINKIISLELHRYDGYELVMSVIGADVTADRSGNLSSHVGWCREQLAAYRELKTWRDKYPNKILSRPIEWIPRFMERAVPFERLAYKAAEGSYKAPDMLELLVRFTAIVVLGGDPWVEMVPGEMEDQLRLAYERQQQPHEDAPDVIGMAFKWAHAPLVGSWIHFEDEELMLGVEALCFLVDSVPADKATVRLAAAYAEEDPGDHDMFELGQTMHRLGATRADIIAAAELDAVAKNVHLLQGWDDVEGEGGNSPENSPPAPKSTPSPTKSSARRRLDSAMRGIVSGIASGIMGGGLFGVFVLIGEQFDSPYHDPSLVTIIIASPLYGLLGAIIGLPFGLASGLIYGLVAHERINSQHAPFVGLLSGGVVGAAIGFALRSSGGRLADWEDMFWALLFLTCATLAGAVGGWLGGRLNRRLHRSND